MRKNPDAWRAHLIYKRQREEFEAKHECPYYFLAIGRMLVVKKCQITNTQYKDN